MVDRAAAVKALCCVTLTYDSWTINRTDSLYQTVNGLVGNVDWGESLPVVAYEFPGPNTPYKEGARYETLRVTAIQYI